ncbi:uncharacterized protein [Macrobrachium rosenbergii]|uniref:uncharacterized protein n=1 Tax=Macrobrachium rosenbergii TaxID=79674 RepID=UPI0034D5FF3B
MIAMVSAITENLQEQCTIDEKIVEEAALDDPAYQLLVARVTAGDWNHEEIPRNCMFEALLQPGGPLTYGELMKAKVKLLYCAQREAFAKEINALALSQPLPKGSPLVKLDPYLDEEGLLRIKGRLENAELSFESLDLAGPLFCVDFPSKRLYILLFTCAVVRAVHLELTESLSVTDCSLAIRRFTARRGVPSVFYSDNAKTFLGASNLLKQHYGPMAPQWKFIVPNAPWWGGWWERLIRSVKVVLRKTLGTKTLSRSELETTLHEVEACINSRPLTFVGEEPDVANPLTPSHFLIGRSAGFQVELADDSASVKEERVPRLLWPLGVITELYPGKDGMVRSAKVKTKRGFVTRPVQNLYNLEISDISEESVCNSPDEIIKENPVVGDPMDPVESITESTVGKTRRGRSVKVPVKLDL